MQQSDGQIDASHGAGVVESCVIAAKRLLNSGRLAEALKQLELVLRHDHEHREALYLIAVCFRYLGDLRRAFDAQDDLLKRHPRYARGFQERGHLCKTLGRTTEAVTAYERAVTLNPGLLSSWIALAALYRASGKLDGVSLCEEQIKELRELPSELLAAKSMLHEGDVLTAEKICRAHLQQHPKHIGAMRLLAKIAADLGILDQALFLLQSAIEFDPACRAARFEYAQMLHRRQQFALALEHAEILLAHSPDNPAYQLVQANAAAALGRFANALECYDRLLAAHPDSAPLQVLKGHALKSLGDADAAVAAYRAAAGLKPDFGDAWWSLANLKTYRFDPAEVAIMENAETECVGIDRQQLCFALGKSYEDRGDYHRSFEYYSRGNALKLAECGYRAATTEQEFAEQRAVCTRDFFAKRSDFGVSSNEPIFIVGLPRSGSTLLEQILASHPQVDGTIELPNIIALVQRFAARHRLMAAPRYPRVLESLSTAQLARFGQEYLLAASPFRHGAAFFTDKTPNNFRHIGLIHLLFPNARIIDARREPLACCFSNFKQLFGEGQYFSYGLAEVAHYYRSYEALMQHWDAVLPNKILRVQYEDVIADLSTQVRRILDFLELPFDARCLDFHRNRRAVHTPSAEQVRQRIYLDGLTQWRHFEPFLGPLKTALGLPT